MDLFDPEQMSFVEWSCLCFAGVLLVFLLCQGIAMHYEYSMCN